jgi:hypothetical protein
MSKYRFTIWFEAEDDRFANDEVREAFQLGHGSFGAEKVERVALEKVDADGVRVIFNEES